MKKYIERYRYELITFVSGGVVMVLELVGARMLAPYVGTSIYVWTAMIGVILGALSVGYWYGGRLADRGASDAHLMKVVTIAAVCILVSLLLHIPVLDLVTRSAVDVRLTSLVAGLVLFAPAALLLGIVSPYVARLRLESLADAGASLGRLYAAGTAGSIAGTFLAGYWLISWFGNRALGLGLVVVLLGLSWFIYRTGWRLARILIGLLALGAVFLGSSTVAANVIADIDSAYSRYLVTESVEEPPKRSLVTDPFSVQSAQYVGQPDVLVARYTQLFAAVTERLRPESLLVVGGGAYTFPLAMSRTYPSTDVTVVEIDPELTELSREYFGLQDRHNLAIIHQDGRVFLNQAASEQYDVVFMDAFSSLTPPYQLATTQALRHESRLLRENGVVITNVIAQAQDDPYLEAVVATHRSVFRHVSVYQVDSSLRLSDRQNLLVVAGDGSATGTAEKALGGKPVVVHRGVVLTDDHAPVEQLISH